MLTATSTECGNMHEFAFIFFFPFEKSLLSEMFHKMFFFTFVSTHIISHCEQLESRNEILFFITLLPK